MNGFMLGLLLLASPGAKAAELPVVGTLTCRAMAYDLTEKKRVPDVIQTCPIRKDPELGAIASCEFKAFGELTFGGSYLTDRISGVWITYKGRDTLTSGENLEIIDDETKMDYTVICFGTIGS